jgi:hypothetical protein
MLTRPPKADNPAVNLWQELTISHKRLRFAPFCFSSDRCPGRRTTIVTHLILSRTGGLQGRDSLLV